MEFADSKLWLQNANVSSCMCLVFFPSSLELELGNSVKGIVKSFRILFIHVAKINHYYIISYFIV